MKRALCLAVFLLCGAERSSADELDRLSRELKTPEQAVEWVQQNGVQLFWRSPNHIPPIREVARTKEGVCEDWARLINYVLEQNRVPNEVYAITFAGLGAGHAVVVYRTPKGTCNIISNDDIYETPCKTARAAINYFYPDMQTCEAYAGLQRATS